MCCVMVGGLLIVSIFKKGIHSDHDNLGGIRLIPVVIKIVDSIMLRI